MQSNRLLTCAELRAVLVDHLREGERGRCYLFSSVDQSDDVVIRLWITSLFTHCVCLSECVHLYSICTHTHTHRGSELRRTNEFLYIFLASHPSRLFPPALADRRQLLRSGLQPASRGNQHHRGNPALYRQRRRHDLGGGV